MIEHSEHLDSKYFEISHTSDLAMWVCGDDLSDLMRNAADGMFALMGLVDEKGSVTSFDLKIPPGEVESLLVDYLNELLFYLDQEIVLRLINAKIDEDGLAMQMQATKLAGRDRYIKAATFHDLSLKETEKGLTAVIVFDV